MCADDPLASLERELNGHVGFQRTHGGRLEFNFADALRGHRRQVLTNLRDDGDETWFKRNSLLEKLADQRGVDLTAELQVKDVLDSHRARQGKSATLW